MCRHAALARGALRVRHGVADLRPCASQRSSNAALSAVPGTRQHPEVPPHRLSLAAPGSTRQHPAVTRQQTRQTRHPAHPGNPANTRQYPPRQPGNQPTRPARQHPAGNPATRAQVNSGWPGGRPDPAKRLARPGRAAGWAAGRPTLTGRHSVCGLRGHLEIGVIFPHFFAGVV